LEGTDNGNGTWSIEIPISESSTSVTYYAQAAAVSASLGDGVFGLNASLMLQSAAAIEADPLLSQATTNPATSKPTTRPEFYIATNRDSFLDAANRRYVIVGQQMNAWVVSGPAILFPASSQYLWEVGGNAILNYTATDEKAVLTPIPYGPYALSSKGDSPIKWYWIQGAIAGTSDTIRVLDRTNGGSSTSSILVYSPAGTFTADISKQKEAAQVGIIKNHQGITLHLATANPRSVGFVIRGDITTPSVQGSAGILALAQLINSSRAYQAAGAPKMYASSNGYVLDDPFSYGNVTVPLKQNAPASVNGFVIGWNDTPWADISGDVWEAISESFKDYILYKPSGENSIYVAIYSGSWQWSANANLSGTNSNVAGDWTVTESSSSPKHQNLQATSEPPVWNSNFTDNFKQPNSYRPG
jgi:hypothetical protein